MVVKNPVKKDAIITLRKNGRFDGFLFLTGFLSLKSQSRLKQAEPLSFQFPSSFRFELCSLFFPFRKDLRAIFVCIYLREFCAKEQDLSGVINPKQKKDQ